MASSTSSFLTQVARSATLARPRAATSAVKSLGFTAHAQVARRSFVMSALTRSVLPRRLFPCDMLLARNASTAARAAHIPEAIYAEEVEAEEADAKDPATHFQTLTDRVHPATLKAITVHPFKHTHMSAVQARIFPLLPNLAEPHDFESSQESPRDLLVKAKTGTGKTMGFLVPAIEARVKTIEAHVEQAKINSGLDSFSAVDASKTATNFAIQNVGTLVISPTRELATQIGVEAQNLTHHHRNFGVHVLVGGENKFKQVANWRGRKDIVVATPGRLMDLLENEPSFAAAFKSTQVLVLDEADTLLDMGFREDIERISSYLPPAPIRQTFLFSATVSKAIQGIATKLLHPRHTFINCVSDDEVATHTHIPQYTTTIKSGADLIPHVLKLIAHDQLLCGREGRKSKVVLFSSTTKMTQLLAKVLDRVKREKFDVLPMQTNLFEMHSKREMEQRIKISKRFREDVAPSSGSVLITSDVSARGVDYPGVTRVIQLGLPPSVEMYVHRVGRTGRGGDRGGQGRGDLVICDWEKPWLAELKRETGTELKTVTSSAIDKEVQQFFETDNSTASSSRPRGYSRAQYDEIPGLVSSVTQRIGDPAFDEHAFPGNVGSSAVSDTMLSYAGFYGSRFSSLNKATLLDGIRTLFMEMFGHARPMSVPRKLEQMMSSGMADSGYRKRGNSFAYTNFGAGKRDRYSDYDATPSRFGGSGRGREGYGAESRSSFGGRSSQGYGSSSRRFDREPEDYGYGSRASRSERPSGREYREEGGRRSGGRGRGRSDQNDDW